MKIALIIPFLLLIISINEACMTSEELQNHIGDWVNKVPYRKDYNASWGYPTDCSGFVSWAYNVTESMAFDWGNDDHSKAIDTKDLIFGDVIVAIYDCDM